MAADITADQLLNPQLKNRTIRVFISSTFKDMQQERELLVKDVFPELRSICAQRLVTFTEVDLRWGINEEQSAEGNTLLICLEEIHLSRPYFIGLLGERYGSVPKKLTPEILEKEPWLIAHKDKQTSVTELEILYRVLREPLMEDHTFFYFRDPAYLERISEGDFRAMTEQDDEDDKSTFGGEEAALRTERRKAKLLALKDRIRNSELPLIDNYFDPQALADTVRTQFIRLINRLYPENDIPDPVDQERHLHEVYAQKKIIAYVRRPEQTAIIDAYMRNKSTGKGLLITGESGSGKTCLLAEWAGKWQKRHPGELCFQHYFGATPESSAMPVFLHRLLTELKRIAGIQDEIPDTIQKMIDALPLWLARTAGKGKVTLVLDAVNQIQGVEPDQRLTWLPKYFPPHVRVVASGLPGKALKTLKEQSWEIHTLPLVRLYSMRVKMIDVYLRQYGKTMTQEMKRGVAEAEATANPLFLRTVLEELRQFGSRTELPKEIKRYLAAKNTVALFRLVIQRWQRDFDAGLDLMRRLLTRLWAARQGLSETELLELLGTNNKTLPRSVFSPLFLAVQPHLTQVYGLYTFGHDFLRKATKSGFLRTNNSRDSAHRELADFFETRPVGRRKAIELPFQLREINENERLKKQLLDIAMFSELFGHNKFELLRYWVWLKQEKTMGAGYLQSFENWAAGKKEAAEVAFKATELYVFLNEASLYAQAEPLMRRALAIDQGIFGDDSVQVATHKNNLAVLFKSTGRFKDAERYMGDALEIFRKKYPPGDPKIAVQCGNLAMLLVDMGKFAEAEPLAREALQIYERNYGESHPEVAVRLGYLAVLFSAANKPDDAEKYIRRALRIDEQHYEKDHPRIANDLNILAQLRQNTGRLKEAEDCMLRAISINEKVYGKNNPIVAVDLNNLAQLLKVIGRFDEAEPLFGLALSINEQYYGRQDTRVATVLNNMGGLFLESERAELAESYIIRALRIERKIHGNHHPDVAACLCSLGAFYTAVSEPVKAEQSLLDALKIDRKCYGEGHPDVARDMAKLGYLFLQAKRLSEAELTLEKALRINGQNHKTNHPDTAAILNNLAELYVATDRTGAAIEYLQQALRIDKAFFGQHHATVELISAPLARLLMDAGRFGEAEPLLVQNLENNLQIHKEEHPDVAVSLVNLFELFIATNRLEEAEQKIVMAIKIDSTCYTKNDINVADDLANYAILLRKLNKLEDAEKKMRRAIAIYKINSGETDPVLPHLLNNLCTILVMQNKLDKAKPLLKQAWALKSGGHDLTSAKVLFVQYAIALLENGNTSKYLGRLKTLLTNGGLTNDIGVSKRWDIEFFISHISPRLRLQAAEFLTLLAGVLNGLNPVTDLDENEQWKRQQKVPI